MEQKGTGSRLFGSRTRMVMLALGAGFAALIIRLFYLQVVQADMWREKASSQQMYSTSISANRGNIFDRNMKTLAKSVTVWTVFISPAEMEENQRELVASGLSEILDVDYDMVYEKSLKTWRYNETIKKKVDNDTGDRVTAFIKENDIKGIYLSEDSMRYYPYGNLASTVLGFTGNDGSGAYGLEAYYNKTLSGTNGVIASVRNAKGTAMPFSEQQIFDAEDGQSLVLTIDETVQHYLEKHLENAVQEHEVQNRAVGIVMNVKTGEVLGMSTKPDFDPNKPGEIYDPNIKEELDERKEEAGSDEEKLDAYYEALGEAQLSQWRNKAISDPYEPGSVFKLITASAALETGTVTGSTYFHCPGYIEVAGNRIACWKRGGHGDLDFVGAIKGSCNPAFIMTGQALGAELFMEYLDKFGLYGLTGVDLPGEATSIMHSRDTMMNENKASLSSASFGQTFKVTALQLWFRRCWTVTEMLSPTPSRWWCGRSSRKRLRPWSPPMPSRSSAGPAVPVPVQRCQVTASAARPVPPRSWTRTAMTLSSPSTALPRRTTRRSQCWSCWTNPRRTTSTVRSSLRRWWAISWRIFCPIWALSPTTPRSSSPRRIWQPPTSSTTACRTPRPIWCRPACSIGWWATAPWW